MEMPMAMMRFGGSADRALFFRLGGSIGNNGRRKFAAGGTLGDFDFFDQQVGDGFEMTGGGVRAAWR